MSPRVTAVVVGILGLCLTVVGFAFSPVVGLVFAICTAPAVVATGLRAGMVQREERDRRAAATAARPAPTRRTGGGGRAATPPPSRRRR